MNPRNLNTIVNLLIPARRRDDQTGEETLTHQRYHRKVPADWEDVSGGVTRRGQQVEAEAEAIFRVHYIEGVADDWRVEVVETGAVFDIKAILDRRGTRRWLELQCARVV